MKIANPISYQSVMTKHVQKFFIAVLTAFLFIPVSCVDLEFDEPPAGGEDPNLPVNITIAALKSRHVLEAYEQITDDVTFAGLVISDDAQGNFFKQLVIEDSTGGIEMRIEMTDLNNLYPVGRKVYVKAKGLYLGDYNGLIQLGAGVGTDNNGNPELIRIPESILDQYIVGATYGNEVVPHTLTIDQLSLNNVSTLVRFENVQFISADAGQTYADAELQQTLNREVEDCAKRRLIVRTSGYASFAGDTTPLGGGELYGVLSVFGDVYQLTIRDLNDVAMNGERCTTGGNNPTTISAIRALYAGSTTALTSYSIKGVVTSDFNSQSVTGKNLFLQDATGGIAIRFAATHFFALGSEISIDVTGGLLGEFNGLLQIDGLNTSAATVVSNPGDVTPRTATINEILTNAQAWESTLVKIDNAEFTGDSMYFGGEIVVTDASGSMIMFTRSQAYFSHTALPTGKVSITAILSEFNSPQLIIRNLSDVSGGGSGSSDLNVDFSGLADNVDISLSGWANIAVKGTRKWRSQVDAGNTYAQATAFGDQAAEMESWLITPTIALDVAKKITFESAYGFFVHDGLTVWISSNFDGSNVTGATWQQLTPTLATSSDTEGAFIPSGNIDLSAFSGNVRVGFKYVGSGPGGQTTSWRVDTVKVEKL